RGIDKPASRRIQFGDESIRKTCIVLLKTIGGNREIIRSCNPDHVSLTQAVNGNAVPGLIPASPQKSGVQQSRTVGIQFGDEGGSDSRDRRLKGARRRREIRRSGGARYIRLAAGIHHNVRGFVKLAAPNEGGIYKGCACLVELRHERVTVTAKGRIQPL